MSFLSGVVRNVEKDVGKVEKKAEKIVEKPVKKIEDIAKKVAKEAGEAAGKALSGIDRKIKQKSSELCFLAKVMGGNIKGLEKVKDKIKKKARGKAKEGLSKVFDESEEALDSFVRVGSVFVQEIEKTIKKDFCDDSLVSAEFKRKANALKIDVINVGKTFDQQCKAFEKALKNLCRIIQISAKLLVSAAVLAGLSRFVGPSRAAALAAASQSASEGCPAAELALKAACGVGRAVFKQVGSK